MTENDKRQTQLTLIKIKTQLKLINLLSDHINIAIQIQNY